MQHLIATPQAASDWGTIPDWVTSIGTILAFSLAFALALREAHFRSLATRDDEMRQARLIVVYPPVLRRSTEDEEAMAIFVPIFNYSEQPIQDLIIALPIGRAPDEDHDHDDHIHEYKEPGPDHRHAWVVTRVTPSGSSDEPRSEDPESAEEAAQIPDPVVSYLQFDFLGPKEKEEAEFGVPPGEGRPFSDSPAIWFLDANGRRWVRICDWSEPARVFDFIPPYLPASVRAETRANMARTRKRSWRRAIRKMTTRISAANRRSA